MGIATPAGGVTSILNVEGKGLSLVVYETRRSTLLCDQVACPVSYSSLGPKRRHLRHDTGRAVAPI